VVTTKCIEAGVTSKLLGLWELTTAWWFRGWLGGAGASEFLLHSKASPSISAMVDESDEQIKNRYEFGGGIEFAEGDIRAVNEVSIAWAKEKGLI